MEEIQVCSNEGPGHALLKGEIKQNSKIILKTFKNPLFKSTWPISNKFGTKHPWVDGIQIFTNKGPHPSSRGDNSKHNKNMEKTLNNFYFRTTGPASAKLGIKHHWVIQEIQIFFK